MESHICSQFEEIPTTQMEIIEKLLQIKDEIKEEFDKFRARQKENMADLHSKLDSLMDVTHDRLRGKAYNILVVGACESEDKAYKVFEEMSHPILEEDLLDIEDTKAVHHVFDKLPDRISEDLIPLEPATTVDKEVLSVKSYDRDERLSPVSRVEGYDTEIRSPLIDFSLFDEEEATMDPSFTIDEVPKKVTRKVFDELSESAPSGSMLHVQRLENQATEVDLVAGSYKESIEEVTLKTVVVHGKNEDLKDEGEEPTTEKVDNGLENSARYVFDEMTEPVPKIQQSFTRASLFRNEMKADSPLNKVDNQWLENEVKQPPLLKMISINVGHHILDGMLKLFCDEPNEECMLTFGFVQLTINLGCEATKVSSSITLSRSMSEGVSTLIAMENHELDVELWFGKLLMLLFDPGGGYLPPTVCHATVSDKYARNDQSSIPKNMCVCIVEWGTNEACKPLVQLIVDLLSWIQGALDSDDVGLVRMKSCYVLNAIQDGVVPKLVGVSRDSVINPDMITPPTHLGFRTFGNFFVVADEIELLTWDGLATELFMLNGVMWNIQTGQGWSVWQEALYAKDEVQLLATKELNENVDAVVIQVVQVNAIWGDESEFADIIDLDHFKKVLANDVRILSLLPSTCLGVLDHFHEARFLSGQNVVLIMDTTLENFVWHPGLCAIFIYILEDKGVFKRVGKWMISMDTILDVVGYGHVLVLNEMLNIWITKIRPSILRIAYRDDEDSESDSTSNFLLLKLERHQWGNLYVSYVIFRRMGRAFFSRFRRTLSQLVGKRLSSNTIDIRFLYFLPKATKATIPNMSYGPYEPSSAGIWLEYQPLFHFRLPLAPPIAVVVVKSSSCSWLRRLENEDKANEDSGLENEELWSSTLITHLDTILEHFVWDPGLIWGFSSHHLEIQTFHKQHGLIFFLHQQAISRVCTTLRTRLLLRGGVCHELSR